MRWRCSSASSCLACACVRPKVSAEQAAAMQLPTCTSCVCTLPSAPLSSIITRQYMHPSPSHQPATSMPLVAAAQGLAVGGAILPNGSSFPRDAVDSLKPSGWLGTSPHILDGLVQLEYETRVTYAIS